MRGLRCCFRLCKLLLHTSWHRHRLRHFSRLCIHKQMSYTTILKRHFRRKSVTIFSIPARVMSGVHNTVAALSLKLLAVLIHSYCICFVVCKQHHICPFFHKRRYLRRSFLAEFQFPAVISAQLVRLFKLPHLSVSRKHNVDTAVNYLLQEIKELAYLLFLVNIAVAVAEIFNAFLLMCRADSFNAKLFSPIKCINDKGLAEPAVHSFLYLVFEHFPA